jgi:hypothetical protein
MERLIRTPASRPRGRRQDYSIIAPGGGRGVTTAGVALLHG